MMGCTIQVRWSPTGSQRVPKKGPKQNKESVKKGDSLKSLSSSRLVTQISLALTFEVRRNSHDDHRPLDICIRL